MSHRPRRDRGLLCPREALTRAQLSPGSSDPERVVTHISLEWLGAGRWRLSVTRGQAGPGLSASRAAADEPGTLRRVSTVEGTFDNLREVALRAFRTLELEFDTDATLLGVQPGELEPTLAYPISLDAVTPINGFDAPTPVVKNPCEATTSRGESDARLELADVTLVRPPAFGEGCSLMDHGAMEAERSHSAATVAPTRAAAAFALLATGSP